MSHLTGTHCAALRQALDIIELPNPLEDRSVIDSRPFEGKRILDLGAGKGPFPWVAGGAEYILGRRLKMTVDVPEAGQVANPELWTDVHVEADLDDVPRALEAIETALGESCAGYFDVITALELAEHLENPWALHRMLAHMLAPGGVAIVSTPNLGSKYAQKCFAECCMLPYFTPSDIGAHGPADHGHISPIFPHLWREMVKRAGLRVASEAFNEPPSHWMAKASPEEKSQVRDMVLVWRLER